MPSARPERTGDPQLPAAPPRRGRPRGAWSWYEEQIQGLGDQFLDVVRLTIELAAGWPNSGAPVVYDTAGEVTERKVATPGFPYTARYRVIGDVVIVMAVYHQRRHPDVGADRQL